MVDASLPISASRFRNPLDAPPASSRNSGMKLGALNIHPARLIIPALSFAASFISIGVFAYWIWALLSDWQHLTLARIVVVVACVLLGGMTIEVIIPRTPPWPRPSPPRL